MKIFIIEDEPAIREELVQLLQKYGYQCDSSDDFHHIVQAALSSGANLILLDINLPYQDGFQVCREIRQKSNLPIIVLTSRNSDFDELMSLNIGADDYIAKPFRPRELVSRINSVLRRCGKSQKLFDIDNIRVDLDKGVVYKNGQDLFLSALEYRLLLAFINSDGRLLTRSRLLEEIWDVAGDFVNDNTLTVYIKRLRDKIEDNPAEPKIIVTVRGMGYKLGK